MFVFGLKSHQYADIRTKIISTIDSPNAADITLQKLVAECYRMSSLKSDTVLVETSTVKAIQNKNLPVKQNKQQKHQAERKQEEKSGQQQTKKLPKTSCWFCGEMHFSRFCKFKTHVCTKCNKKGHKEGYCVTSKGKTASTYAKIIRVNQVRSEYRKYITVNINNIDCVLQIDTGSDITLISSQMRTKIGEPNCHPCNQSVQNASGDALKITSEFQCPVKFGQRAFKGTAYLTPINAD